MGKGGFFCLSFPFPVGRADSIASFAEGGSYASAFCFVVFYGCAFVFGGEDVDVVSCCEMDVFGMYGAAFDGYVFFGDDSGCSSCGDPVLPLASSVTVSAWSFHPVLPRLILIPTALFLLMALSVF